MKELFLGLIQRVKVEESEGGGVSVNGNHQKPLCRVSHDSGGGEEETSIKKDSESRSPHGPRTGSGIWDEPYARNQLA